MAAPLALRARYWAFALFGPRRSLARLRELGQTDLMPRVDWSSRYALSLFAYSCRLARTGPPTVLHGDAHVGNTYRLPEGRLGFYDWQFVRTGAWSHDVGSAPTDWAVTSPRANAS